MAEEKGAEADIRAAGVTVTFAARIDRPKDSMPWYSLYLRSIA